MNLIQKVTFTKKEDLLKWKNSSEFKPKYFLASKSKKKDSNRILNSQEIVNDISNNILNSKSESPNNYVVSNYGSYTLGGTDAFGRIKTNQDAYL